ncbi:MAG: inositol monophosphatase [Verrucomicrobia bacterium Tous-C9LFEB]|nr:MAG: inositol monophosphatase [Verrucomicrobia bacterium Tous-C9LFEB]
MPSDLDSLRRHLCFLQDTIRDAVCAAHRTNSTTTLAAVAAETISDTIYQIDKVSEVTILAWFEQHWPSDEPVELVMEGIEELGPVTFPKGTPPSATKWKCIIDPIDGTRGIMYDKRAAWSLAGLAPQRGADTNVSDIVVAAMTELPTTKQWRADQISGIKGCGPTGIVAEKVSVLDGTRQPLRLEPSRATDFKHGFASLCKFFPEGKTLIASIEEELWGQIYGLGKVASPFIFDDQYISTGGQFYEIMSGHDRMIADIRPLVLRKLGYGGSLVCHPYDCCTALLVTELGGIVETERGEPLHVPLDTVTPVVWIAYANASLADIVRPVLQQICRMKC